MRVNLEVPYGQKEQAKRYGAKWDTARKCWYVIDPVNMVPLLKWIPGAKCESERIAHALYAHAKPGKKKHGKRKKSHAALPAARSTSHLPYADVPPWEDMDAEAGQHIASIMQEL